MGKKFFFATVFVTFLVLIIPAKAHQINQSYIYLKVYESSVSGRFEMAINDLNALLNKNYGNDISIDYSDTDKDEKQDSESP